MQVKDLWSKVIIKGNNFIYGSDLCWWIHVGQWYKCFSCYFLRFLPFFPVCDGKRQIICFNTKNDFDQRMWCKAPVCWSKYTTLHAKYLSLVNHTYSLGPTLQLSCLSWKAIDQLKLVKHNWPHAGLCKQNWWWKSTHHKN